MCSCVFLKHLSCRFTLFLLTLHEKNVVMKPIIGISGNFRLEEKQCTLAEGYYQSLVKAGAIPVILPPFDVEKMSDDDAHEVLGRLDGIVFSGGGDIDSSLLGEETIPEVSGVDSVRDRFEMALVRWANNHQLPMLGICKGAQVINAALGGQLHQDINRARLAGLLPESDFCHSQTTPKSETSHQVNIEEGTILAGLLGKSCQVNSFHHQAIKSPAPGFRVSAKSQDGVIEAIESTQYKSILGLQWHPEALESMSPVFDWFVGESISFREARTLHKKILTLDSHCDTPMVFDGVNPDDQASQSFLWDIKTRNPLTLVDEEKMREGHLDATIMVAYLKQEGRDDKSLLLATEKADRILSHIEKMANVAYTPDDLWKFKREGKPAVMMGIENGYAIGKDIANVERFRRRGVVYMTLCHNGDNDICDSARGNNEHRGVSPFGADVIKEMNRVGMMVDLSHAGEKSFYDALDISTTPIVCSHSSARALCDHPRNLTDDQMIALSRANGVAQVTFYDGFLRLGGGASILDAVSHLNYMVKKMGIEHVGIGTDFDGDGGVPGIASASELINFTRRLLAERYSPEEIQMLWGGNFLRIMKLCQNR